MAFLDLRNLLRLALNKQYRCTHMEAVATSCMRVTSSWSRSTFFMKIFVRPDRDEQLKQLRESAIQVRDE